MIQLHLYHYLRRMYYLYSHKPKLQRDKCGVIFLLITFVVFRRISQIDLGEQDTIRRFNEVHKEIKRCK